MDKSTKIYPFIESTSDWGWQKVSFKECLTRPCYIGEAAGHDGDYYSDIIGSQYLLLRLDNAECPMQLDREMVKNLVKYLETWLNGRLFES